MTVCPKTYFKKQAPKLINYRNYKNFSSELFRADLIKELSNNRIPEHDLISFLDACKKSLDYHAPPKNKYIRANRALFMPKELNKEIMIRSRLRNKFPGFRSKENLKSI